MGGGAALGAVYDLFDWTGGFATCINEIPTGVCGADWHEEGNWIYECPLPPPQVCPLEYPDESTESATILWDNQPELGLLTIRLINLTIGSLRIGVPSLGDYEHLALVFEGTSLDGSTISCQSFQIVGTVGAVSFAATRNGGIVTY